MRSCNINNCNMPPSCLIFTHNYVFTLSLIIERSETKICHFNISCDLISLDCDLHKWKKKRKEKQDENLKYYLNDISPSAVFNISKKVRVSL